MIPIKIGEQKFKIKSIKELTTREFIELDKIQPCDIIKYISWQTGQKMDDCFFAVTSATVANAIGQIPDIRKMPCSKNFNYKTGIDTVGQRHQVETSELTGLELLVRCLAIAQAKSNNIDDIIKLETVYFDMPFTEILPSGFFFFRSYRYGKKGVLNFLRKLPFLIPTLKRKKKLG